MEKKLAKTVRRVQTKNPAATVEVWTEDEHRLGLKPVNRIIWVEKGMQPIAKVNWRFQWLWLIGFVHPGINLVWMPPKSPELQPAERLWPLTDESVANRTFTNLDELEDVVFERCRILLQQTELVRGLTHYHWWPKQ